MEGISTFDIDDILVGQVPRTNINVVEIDGKYYLRVARLGGSFPWHRHPDHDECWLVWKGRLRLDFEDGTSAELSAGEGARVPKGVAHRPVALDDDTIVVFVNAVDFPHEYLDRNPDMGDYVLRDLD